MKGNTPIIVGVLVVFAALAAFLLLSRKNTASAGSTATDGNTYTILPGISSGSNIMSFGTWYAKRKGENFSFDTTLLPASNSRL